MNKLSPAGDLVWTKEIGTSAFESATGVAADKAGNAVVVGVTRGDLVPPNFNHGTYSPFISKLDANGDTIWTHQIREFGYGSATSVALDDAGNLYVAGAVGGSEATADAFVSKLDGSGNQLWTRRMGGPYQDDASAIAVDGWGNIFISGSTAKHSASSAHRDFDAYISKLNENGDLIWTVPFGIPGGNEYAHGVAVDDRGGAYVSGQGFGLGGVALGGYDGFVAKVAEVPEPSSLGAIALGVIVFAARLSRITSPSFS